MSEHAHSTITGLAEYAARGFGATAYHDAGGHVWVEHAGRRRRFRSVRQAYLSLATWSDVPPIEEKRDRRRRQATADGDTVDASLNTLRRRLERATGYQVEAMTRCYPLLSCGLRGLLEALEVTVTDGNGRRLRGLWYESAEVNGRAISPGAKEVARFRAEGVAQILWESV